MITALPGLKPEAIPDAPPDPWFATLLEHINMLGRQIVPEINGLPDRVFKTFDFVDGVSFSLKSNPLSLATDLVIGIVPMACLGVSVDSTGKPTGSFFDLAIPTLQWKYSGTAIVMVAKFATVGARGRVGLEFRGR